MPWFAVDDQFHSHPKLAELEAGRHFAEALALWTLAGSWCALHLTDGFVPLAQLRKLVPFAGSKPAAELVRVGLWEEVEGGFRFRDWGHYQPTKSEVENARAASARRSRKYRKIQASRVTEPVTEPVTDGVSHALRHGARTLSPSHTLKIPPTPPTGGEVAAEGPELPEPDLSASPADLRSPVTPPPEPPPPGVRYFETPTVLDDFAKQWAKESSRRGGPGLAPYAPPTPRDAAHAKSIVERALAAFDDDPAKAGAFYERELRGYLRHHVDPSSRRDAHGRVVSSPIGYFASGFGGWANGR